MANQLESIVFIDAGVDNPGQLADGVTLDAEVLILSPLQDGVKQIAAAISTRPEVTEIHIVAHGSPGEIALGNTKLGLNNLAFYADFLTQWSNLNRVDHLYLYGCNVGAGDAGAEFLAQLRSLTQANIGASSRLIGHTDRGGSWTLDTMLGHLPSRTLLSAAAIATYPGTLNTDNFANATPLNLTDGAATDTGNNATAGPGGTLATHETGEPIHDPTVSGLDPIFQRQLNNSIWWKWDADVSGLINVNTLGSSVDTVLAVYTGTTVGNLTLVASNDDANGKTTSSLTFDASVGTTYFFAVDGGNNDTGEIVINLDSPPNIPSGQLFSVSELANPGDSVEPDPDPDTSVANPVQVTGDDVISWLITSGNPDNDGDGVGAFAIDNNGQLTVVDADELDFESTQTLFPLTVKATDDGGFSDTETIFIQVTDENEAPEIVNVTAPTSASEGNRITLTGQIFDPDTGDTQTVVIDWGDGTTTTVDSDDLVDIDSEGNKTFSRNHTYADNGTYEINVSVTDGDGEVDELAPDQTRTITINNIAPTIAQGATQTFTIDEDSQITFLLSANDPSTADTLAWSVGNAAAGNIDFAAATPDPTQPSQLFTYQPDANFTGSDTFQIQVVDDDGGTDTIDVTVNVTARPDAPSNLTLTPTPAEINEGEAIALTGSFVDPDVGDSFTVNINWGDDTGLTVLTTEDLAFNATTNTYSFNAEHVYLNDDASTISVSVIDSFGAVAGASREIIVNNEAPTLVPGNTSLSVSEDTTGSIVFTANDAADTDFTWTIATQGNNGVAEVTTGVGGTQEIIYTPNPDYNGLDEFVVEVNDGDGGTKQATVSVGVNPVNDAPTDLDITPDATAIDEGQSITLSGSFFDVDNSTNLDLDDSHTLTVDWGDGTVETFQDTELTINTGTPPTAQPTDLTSPQINFDNLTHTYLDEGEGTYTITVTATDDDGESVTTTQTLQVNNVDPEIVDPIAAPVIDTTAEDTPLELSVTAQDAGTDELTWTVLTPPANGTITLGPVTTNGVQTFTYTPNLNYVSPEATPGDPATVIPDTFTLQVTDGDGGFQNIEYQITVTEENDAPTIIINDFNIVEGTPLAVDLTVLDAQDVDNADNEIEFTISGAAASSFLVDGVEDNTFTRADLIANKVSFLYESEVTPAFTISVSDGTESVSAPGNVEFESVNDAPVLTLGTFSVNEGGTTPITSSAIDATDEEISDRDLIFNVSEVQGGEFLVLNPDTNAFEPSNTFTQGQIDDGQVRFRNNDTEVDPSYLITVTDGDITTSPIAGSGTVIRDNDPPTLDVVNFSVTEGVPLPIDLTVLDASDIETTSNEAIEFTITNGDFQSFLIDGAAPDPAATSITFTRQDIINNRISFLYEGETAPTFTITVSDNDPDGAETTSLNVVVEDFTPVNDLPILQLDGTPASDLTPGTSIFTVAENDDLVVDTAIISATDADIADDDQLQFEVSNIEGGDFLVAGVVDTSFTLGQIRSNLVRFRNDGSQLDPSFLITVSDGEFTTEPVQVNGTVDPIVNDAPQITQNSFNIIENQPLLIDENVLDASDEETLDDDLIEFTITNAPDPAVFELKVADAVINPADGLTFTLAQVLNGQVVLTYTGETEPSFQITVNDNNNVANGGPGVGDGDNATAAVLANVNFTAQNDLPDFTGTLTPFEVDEGGRVTITTANIDATDADDPDNSLLFEVSDVQGGTFLVRNPSTNTFQANNTFSRSQITAGDVRFQHDDSETEPSYQITVSDDESTSDAIALTGTRIPVNDPPTIDVNNFVVTEGEDLLVDQTVLDASDEETATTNTDLVFTITSPPGVNDFASFIVDGNVVDPSVVSEVTFTRQDIINNLVVFRYEGETEPQFTITVRDNSDPGAPDVETATAPGNIVDFFPVNDEPQLLLLNDFQVPEDDDVLITTANITASDNDADAADLVFEVSNVQGGDFLVGGVVDTRFTLEQISNSQVRFRNDGSQIDPSYVISVTDGEATSNLVQGNGTVAPINNDAPVITKNTFAIVENQPLLVDSSVLNATDEETLDDTLIQFTITPITPDPSDPNVTDVVEFKVGNTVQNSFTLADVLNERVTLTYTGEITPNFQITVNDRNSAGPQVGTGTDATAIALANINFTPQNDVPIFTGPLQNFQVNEGEQVRITTNNINAFDAETNNSALSFSVSDVAGGNFIVDGTPNSTTFTQAQIVGGAVRFKHDGSGLDPTFSITVTDGTATSAPITLGGTVNEVNDPPTLDENNFVFTEGVPLLVDTSVLDATDEETLDNALIQFNIVPDAGGVFPTGAFEVGGIASNTFTRQDILDERVTFTYDGEETPSFTIEVSDGNSVGPQAGDGADDIISIPAVIDFTSVNDAPTLDIAFPAATVPNTIEEGTVLEVSAPANATADDIVFTAADEETTDPASLVYTVTSDSNVTFKLDGAATDTFTQADLEAGLVTFVHDGSESPTSANFTVTLSDSGSPAAETVEVPVTVTIDPTNDAPQLLLNQLEISEGQTVTLSTGDLNATDVETTSLNLTFLISNIQNGFFTVDDGTTVTIFGENQGATSGSFTLEQVIQEQVTFTHLDDDEVPGNPDSQVPSYEVAVQDLDADGNPGLISSDPVGAAADIEFTATNDAPVLDETLTFTVAEDGVQIITAANINAIDPDTLPANLQYTVSNVVGGFFAKVTEGETQPVDGFTQADINAPSNIVFVHDGSNTAPSYTLKVEDDLGGEDIANFTANLNAQNDTPTIETNTLTLTEGEEVTLTINDLKAVDEESGPSDLTFTITDVSGGNFFTASAGQLIIGGTFTQQEVLDEEVTFKHDGTNDAPTYTLTVTDGGILVGGVPDNEATSVPSTVTPDFTPTNDPPELDENTTGVFTVTQGGSFDITEAILLVTDEETLNKENIVYTITAVNNGNFLVENTIPADSTFTQQDIALGRVTFQHDGSELAPSYTLTVSDTGVPEPETIVITKELGFENTNDAPVIGNNTLSLGEGETVTLSTTNLSATDLETARLDLEFEVTDIKNGTFAVTRLDGSVDVFGEVTPDANPTPTAPSTSGTFTLLDVVENRVTFTHDGFDYAPGYAVTVTDQAVGLDPALSTGPAPATITFDRTNDDPTLIAPADFAFTINEGDTKVVPLTAIDAIDEPGETPQNELQFFISNVSGGYFADADNNEVEITEFSRADVAAGEVIFVHDGENDPPSYTLTVKDAEDGEASADYTGTLVKVNDEPDWTLNTLTLIENDLGDKAFLDGGNLFATDEESNASELTYTLLAIDGGTFFNDNTAIASDGTGTFTQQDVLDGAISFVQDTTDNNAAPSYTLQLSDSGITDNSGNLIPGSQKVIGPPADIATAVVDFTAVNDAPQDFVVIAPTVQEGVPLAVTNDVTSTTALIINATDEESLPAALTYTVDLIENADFKLTTTGEVVTSFTQAQVNAGVITFVHDGSEAAPSFTLTLTDTAIPDDDQVNVLTAVVEPDFQLDNDPPNFDANQLSPIEGEEITLTSANLAASDREDAATQLRFSIDPASVTDNNGTEPGGTFFLNGVALTADTTFSLVQVNAGLLTFKDDGDEFAPTYTVKVTDTDGASTAEAATIKLEGFPVNDDPILETNSFVFEEGAFFVLNEDGVNLSSTDTDNTAAELTYIISDPVGVTFLRNGNEPTLEFTQQEVDLGAIAFKHDNETANPSFTITVTDGNGGEASAPGGVDYTDSNDPPTAVDDGGEGFTTNQNTVLLTPALTANDTDEESAALTVVSINGGVTDLPSGAKVTLNGNSVSYDPNGAFTALALGETTTDTFEYVVSDNDPDGPQTDTGTVTITIEGLNDAPDAVDDAGPTIAENAVQVLNVLGNDTDPDNGATLTISSVDTTGTAGAVINNGTNLTYDATGIAGLAVGEELVDTFTYTVSDGNGGTDTATVTVTVSGVDDPPIAVDDSGEGFVTPDDTQPFTTVALTANDTDGDDDALNITKINDATAAAGDTITLDSGGTLLLNADNTVTYTPPAEFAGLAVGETAEEVFTYTITDGTSESTATATITVTGSNVAPVANDDLDPGFTTNENTAVSLTVLANDTDADGDTLTISAVDLTGVTGSVTNKGSTLTYTPAATFNALQVGESVEETITYTVSDGNGGTDTASVLVTVTGVNDQPIAVADKGTGFTTDEDTAFTLPNVLANDSDPDGDTLTIASLNTSQTQGVVTNKNGTLTYDPNGAFNLLQEGQTATDTFQYTVSDGNGGTATATVTLRITGTVEVPNSFFDYTRFLRYNNPGATIPTDEIDSLPLAQIFDESYYLSQNRDVAVAIGAGRLESAYQHFVNFGIAEGRDPSILFNEEYYLANNEDVRQAVEGPNPSYSSGLQHFLLTGHEEFDRNPSSFFNQRQYLANNQDLVNAISGGDFQSPFEHYIEFGSDEPRSPALALYNEGFYLATNPDIRNAVINGTFASGFEHFVSFGQREGRNPSSLYDEDSYLELNPDVARAVAGGDFISGFQHYSQFGRFEGRPVF